MLSLTKSGNSNGHTEIIQVCFVLFTGKRNINKLYMLQGLKNDATKYVGQIFNSIIVTKGVYLLSVVYDTYGLNYILFCSKTQFIRGLQIYYYVRYGDR